MTGLILLAVFIGFPALEIWLIWRIGGAIGFLPTLGMLIGMGFLGSWLARREGARVMRSFQEAMAGGRVPEEGVIGGALVLLGGVLLIVPGVVSDVLGLILLIPPTRRGVVVLLRRWLERKVRQGRVTVVGFGGAPPGHAPPPDGVDPDKIIDVD